MTPDPIEAAEQRIAAGLHAERTIPALRRQIDAERSSVAALRARLDEEQRDVERLESVTVAGVLARLRRRHEELLDRERADVAAVELELAARDEVVERLRGDLRSAEGVAGDLPAARAALASARAARDLPAAGGRSPRHDELATSIAEAERTLVEIDEARSAARTAADRVAKALTALSSAKSWSTYDTFFGGGLIASAIKHDRFGDAAGAVTGAHHALRRLRSELDDIPAPPDVEIAAPSDQLRRLDVWFDNIFSDLMTHGKIVDSVDRLERSKVELDGLIRELDRRQTALAAHVERDRAELLRLVAD